MSHLGRARPAREGINEWGHLLDTLAKFDPLLKPTSPHFGPEKLAGLEMQIGDARFELRPERISNPSSRGLRGTHESKKGRFRAAITCGWPSSQFSPLRAAQQLVMIERVAKVALFAEHLFADRVYTENGEILVR